MLSRLQFTASFCHGSIPNIIESCIIDFRPYFTYWVTFVQIVVYIIAVIVYGLAPLGFEETEIRGLVCMKLWMYFRSVLRSFLSKWVTGCCKFHCQMWLVVASFIAKPVNRMVSIFLACKWNSCHLALGLGFILSDDWCGGMQSQTSEFWYLIIHHNVLYT